MSETQERNAEKMDFSAMLEELIPQINWKIALEGGDKRIFTQEKTGYYTELTKEEAKIKVRNVYKLATPSTINALTQAICEDADRIIDLTLFRTSRENFVGFLDGCFDLKTGKIRRYGSNDFCLTPLPHRLEYAPYNAAHDAWLCSVLASWVGEECADWLCNVLAYMLFVYPNPEQIWLNFFGMGANGKSLCLKILEKILGDDKLIGCDLGNINRFSGATFHGKWLVIGRDSSSFVSDGATSFIKAYTGEDKGLVEKKGGDSFDVHIQGKLIVSTNTLIQSKDRSYGWYRRLFPIPFPNTFERDPGFERAIMARQRDIIRVLLHRAYCYTVNKIPVSKYIPGPVENLMTETRYLNDRVAAYWETEFFTEERKVKKPVIDKFLALDEKTMMEVYCDYVDWHDKHFGDGQPEPSLKTFGGQYGAFMQHAKDYFSTKKTNRGRVIVLHREKIF